MIIDVKSKKGEKGVFVRKSKKGCKGERDK
jgi:hypothetical protein